MGNVAMLAKAATAAKQARSRAQEPAHITALREGAEVFGIQHGGEAPVFGVVTVNVRSVTLMEVRCLPAHPSVFLPIFVSDHPYRPACRPACRPSCLPVC